MSGISNTYAKAYSDYDSALIHRKKISKTQNGGSLMDEISKQKEEILEKIRKGETEPSFSIGASAFTAKQWDKLMTHVDIAIDDMQKRVDEEKEEQEKKIKKKEENAITMEMLEELLGIEIVDGME